MIDKGLYKKGRVGLKGGADASQFNVANPKKVNVSAGSATLGDTELTKPPTVRDNRNDDTPFVPPTKKKKTVDDVVNRGGPKPNPLKNLLSFLNPLSYFQMLNNPETRKRLTGYETQAEYEQARQNRINLNRIKTIENTLARKYSDGDYSQTDLDERLAALKSQMGITPNTAADLRPDLDFSNLEEGAPDFVPQNEGIKSISTGRTDYTDLQELYDRDKTVSLMKNFIPAPGQTDYFPSQVSGITNTKVEPPDFMFASPQFQEGLDNSMYGGDRMLFGADGNQKYYYGDILPGGDSFRTDADGITNYDFDTPVRVGPENTGFIEGQDTPQSRDDFFLNAMADATTFPTDDGSGISLMKRSILRNAGYNDSQIREAQEDGYLDQLVRDIEGPIGIT